MSTSGRIPQDPKGLIADAYCIEGITAAECRSIFLDWALSIPEDPAEVIPAMLAGRPEDHPMTEVLRAGLSAPGPSGRRGGARGRRGDLS